MSEIKTRLKAYIVANGPVSVVDAAEALNINPKTVSGYTSVMYDAGEIGRVRAFKSERSKKEHFLYQAASAELLPTPPQMLLPPPTPLTTAQTPNPASLDALCEELAQRLVDRVKTILVSGLRTAVDDLLEETMKDFNPRGFDQTTLSKSTQSGEVVKRSPRVVVVGLLPQQANILSNEFADCLDLRFLKDTSASRLRRAATGAALVVAHISHMSHKQLNVGSMPCLLVKVSGGLTKIRDTLTKFYVEGSANG